MIVQDVIFALLALSRSGDDLRGGAWSEIQEWHGDVATYVRAALGDGPADDVATRLRCTRGSNQAEKEANAIGFVNDWLGTQVIGLTAEKIRPGFGVTLSNTPARKAVWIEETEEIPVAATQSASGWAEYCAEKGAASVSAEVVVEQETEDGDIGPETGRSDEAAGEEPARAGKAASGDSEASRPVVSNAAKNS